MTSILAAYACFLQNYVTTQRETRLQNVYKIIKHDEQSSMIFLGVFAVKFVIKQDTAKRRRVIVTKVYHWDGLHKEKKRQKKCMHSFHYHLR